MTFPYLWDPRTFPDPPEPRILFQGLIFTAAARRALVVKNEDDPKNEDELKNEDDPKNEDNPKNEADLEIEDDLKNWPIPQKNSPPPLSLENYLKYF